MKRFNEGGNYEDTSRSERSLFRRTSAYVRTVRDKIQCNLKKSKRMMAQGRDPSEIEIRKMPMTI